VADVSDAVTTNDIDDGGHFDAHARIAVTVEAGSKRNSD
jgi:hypothetical protein